MSSRNPASAVVVLLEVLGTRTVEAPVALTLITRGARVHKHATVSLPNANSM